MARQTWSIVCLAALLAVVAGAGEDDLVKKVPGLIFESHFKVYSGYLNASGDPGSDRLMHYMLTESKGDPANDPLLVWFNGGPGCSSFSGAFEELGPFYINKDGETLFENVYSWNARANVLYLESPIGVGFSYSQSNPNYYQADDNQTLYQNYYAIQDFFNRVQPRFANQTFYLSGESYAGLYLPMLSALITNDTDFPATLGGFAIGNGFMDVKGLTNSLVLWSNYHGRFSLNDWATLKSGDCCTKSNPTDDFDSCDWTGNLDSKNGIDYFGKDSKCGKILNPIVNSSVYNVDPYNFYEDCYNGSFITYFGKPRRADYVARSTEPNTAKLFNRDSTDPFLGYPCWQEDYVAVYFNDPAVQDAYNINPVWRENNLTFADCNMNTYNNYHLTYNNMAPFFDTIIQNAPNFRILVYNGDVDTVCNFLGDAKFIDGVAKTHDFTPAPSRDVWFFRNAVAGFNQRYTSNDTTFLIDVLTIKGAGHMVPLDRPGPALQMITNFVHSAKPDYTDPSLINPVAQPAPLLNTPTPGPATTVVPETTTKGAMSTLSVSILTLLGVLGYNFL
uniref:Carboxypeptidase n=1 Tax=Panagrellus redivivus TaxID=6233 RepID=A0A7E4ZRA9_PANRE